MPVNCLKGKLTQCQTIVWVHCKYTKLRGLVDGQRFDNGDTSLWPFLFLNSEIQFVVLPILEGKCGYCNGRVAVPIDERRVTKI